MTPIHGSIAFSVIKSKIIISELLMYCKLVRNISVILKIIQVITQKKKIQEGLKNLGFFFKYLGTVSKLEKAKEFN